MGSAERAARGETSERRDGRPSRSSHADKELSLSSQTRLRIKSRGGDGLARGEEDDWKMDWKKKRPRDCSRVGSVVWGWDGPMDGSMATELD